MYGCLQHYGIKGMKWGVRRTPEQLGNDGPSSISKIDSRLSSKNIEYGFIPGSDVGLAYDAYEAQAQSNFKNMESHLNRLALATGVSAFNDLSGDYGDAAWAASYNKAIKDLGGISDENAAILIAYGYLRQNGIQEYYDVGWQEKGGKPRLAYKHKKTGKVLWTVPDAVSYSRLHDVRQREKHLDGDPVKVKVNKNRKIKGSVKKTTGSQAEHVKPIVLSDAHMQDIAAANKKKTDKIAGTISDAIMETLTKKKR